MSATSHEPAELLSAETNEMHRAILSLVEELQAIDAYQQRADVCADLPLKEILLHNKNEEVEHASMLIEWIRRHNDRFDLQLRRYLFTEADVVAIEGAPGPSGRGSGESLGIGGRKKG